MKKRRIITAVMIFAMTFTFFSCTQKGTGETITGENTDEVITSGENTLNTGAQPDPTGSMKSIGQSVYVSELSAYSGPYVEDGSNEQVTDIACVTVVNSGEKKIQYLTFEIETAGGKYEFAATTLLPGIPVKVLEKNRKALSPESTFVKGEIRALAEFQKEISDMRDTFQVMITDSVMNIRNISEKDFDTTVYVYYKNTDEKGFVGGITYRVRFDGVKAGEIMQMPSSNLIKGSSKVVFVDYGE